MKSIKIVLAISAILGVALLNSTSASAAKYTVEDTQSNPKYNFLKQRLVRMEIDEDEEIDLNELAKHLFIAAESGKSPIASFRNQHPIKASNLSHPVCQGNLNDAWPAFHECDGASSTPIVSADLKNLRVDEYKEDGIRFFNLKELRQKSLIEDINNAKKDKSKESVKITALLPLNIYTNGGVSESGTGFIYFFNSNQTNLSMSAQELFLPGEFNDFYSPILNLSKTKENALSSSIVTLFAIEEFDLIINRKSTQPQDSDKEDNISTKTETPTPQDAVKETATTQQEVQQISAPNTGFSSFNPISILALLGLASTATFVLRRK